MGLRSLCILDGMFDRDVHLFPSHSGLVVRDCLWCSIRYRGHYTRIHWLCQQVEEAHLGEMHLGKTQLGETKTTSNELDRGIVLIRHAPTHALVPWFRLIDSSINQEPIKNQFYSSSSGECVMVPILSANFQDFDISSSLRIRRHQEPTSSS